MLQIEDLKKIHATGFDLEDVKFTFTHDFKANVADIKIDAREGEIMNIPRYVARVLDDQKHGKIQETDMIVELKQALVKENVQGEFELASLDDHFYVKLQSYMKQLSESDYDKTESMLNSLLRKRQGKIIHLADSLVLTTALSNKMSIEEQEFYNNIYNISSDFTKQIMGKKK